MGRRKTNKEFIQDVYKLVQDEYSVLGVYVNAHTKIPMKHNSLDCQHVFDVKPSNFTNSNSRCPKCFGTPKKTTDEFKKEVYYLVGSEFEVLGEYKNNKNKIQMIHNKCENIFDVRPNDFISNDSRCPKCASKTKAGKLSMSHSDFIKLVYKDVKDEYRILGEYKNSKTKIKIKHNKCGHEYEVIPTNFTNNETRCPNCCKYINDVNTETFKKKVCELVGDEYLVLGEYATRKDKIKFYHKDCGNEFDMRAYAFVDGQRCPSCAKNKFKGVRIIEEFLLENNILFKKEYVIDECRNIRALPFDFGIKTINDELIFLIEFDGKQHYEAVEFFGGEEGFKYRKQNDEIKNKYCKDNNIKLLRIPYWEIDNIEIILNDAIDNKEGVFVSV